MATRRRATASLPGLVLVVIALALVAVLLPPLLLALALPATVVLELAARRTPASASVPSRARQAGPPRRPRGPPSS